jgi:hypothetical protein
MLDARLGPGERVGRAVAVRPVRCAVARDSIRIRPAPRPRQLSAMILTAHPGVGVRALSH